MHELIPDSWRGALAPVLSSHEAIELQSWLSGQEMAGKLVHPPRDARWKALELTPLEEVKVVILGQDPYHGVGQAMGLAFSVGENIRIPPSLRNIYQEMETDLGVLRPPTGDLTSWARQGVLLLNNALTVEDGKAGSHAGKGWEAITDACVAAVADRDMPSVFMLWGAHAWKKADRIEALRDDGRHCIIRSPHPSPLSARRGFFGSRPFSRANAFLAERGRSPIEWARPND